jgi:hypothetical protein
MLAAYLTVTVLVAIVIAYAAYLNFSRNASVIAVAERLGVAHVMASPAGCPASRRRARAAGRPCRAADRNGRRGRSCPVLPLRFGHPATGTRPSCQPCTGIPLAGFGRARRGAGAPQQPLVLVTGFIEMMHRVRKPQCPGSRGALAGDAPVNPAQQRSPRRLRLPACRRCPTARPAMPPRIWLPGGYLCPSAVPA